MKMLQKWEFILNFPNSELQETLSMCFTNFRQHYYGKLFLMTLFWSFLGYFIVLCFYIFG